MVVLGGSILTDELACVGPVAAATVRRYRADLAVLGAAGVSARAGITELSDEAAEIQRLMIEQSERLVVLADGSKLGQATMASVAPANSISLLITDTAAPEQELVELEAVGVEIVVLDRPAARSTETRVSVGGSPAESSETSESSESSVPGISSPTSQPRENPQMKTLKDYFGVEKPLIAMCHLEGLPGRPRYDSVGGLEAIVSSAAREVRALQDGGVDAILFCNENDIPYSTSVGTEVVATMAHVIGRLQPELRVPYGTNLLWDPYASLAAAIASGGSFIREVLTGVYDSDMGLLAPDFGAVAAYRRNIGASHVAMFAQHHPGVQQARSPGVASPTAPPAPRTWAPTRC